MNIKITTIKTKRQNLVQEIQMLENLAHKVDAHVTAHALNRAKNALGWEIAGNIEQAEKAARS
jgi:vacuolar-type H+-ATPase subunit D/Vma8